MSFEINPVLAGKFDVADNTPAGNYASATNIQTSATSNINDVSGPDPRRYTKFDHSDTEAGTANLSFGDFMDMINPLEHIPVVSSVYRAITGEEINPVARVVGDILYGGVLGAGSAVMGGISAIADAGLEQKTGKDSGGLAVAALFGDDKKDAVQLADAGTAGAQANGVSAPAPTVNPQTTQNIELAQAATPTPLLAALQIPTHKIISAAPTAAVSSAAPAIDPAPVAPVSAELAASSSNVATPDASPASVPALQNTLPATGVTPASISNGSTEAAAPLGGIPLAPAKSSPTGKQAFGGVMAPANPQTQDVALALAQGTPGMRMGHMIYTGKLTNGAHPLPPMLSNDRALSGSAAPVVAPRPVVPAAFTPVSTAASLSASLPANGQASMAAIGNLTSQSPLGATAAPAFMQDEMLKALSQYGKAGSGFYSGPSATVNLMN